MLKHKYNKENITQTKRNDKKSSSYTRLDYLSITNRSQTCIKDYIKYTKIKPASFPYSYYFPRRHYLGMISNLLKHNSTKASFEKRIINHIIYDEKKHVVSLFKNHLLWDETADFLKRFYFKEESLSRLPKICAYYEDCSIFTPVYFSLNVAKVMIKNKKKKKKVMKSNEDQDNEDDKVSKGISNANQIMSYFIKPEEVNLDKTTTAQSLSQSHLSYAIRKIAENDRFNNDCYIRNRKKNVNDNDKEISLTEYNENTLNGNGNDIDLNDLINNISIHNQQKGNVSVSNVNFSTYIEMKKLNLGSINDHANRKKTQTASSIGSKKKPLTKCKTERLSQCQINPKTYKPHKVSIPKPKMINKANKDNKMPRQRQNNNNSLNSKKLLNMPKYNITSLSQRMNSIPQSKYYHKIATTKRNKTQRSIKSPDDIFHLRNQRMLLSNANHTKRTQAFIKESTINSISNANRNHSKRQRSKESHLNNSSFSLEKNQKEFKFKPKISPIITPKSLIITKLTKNSSKKTAILPSLSGNIIPIENNIKVNLKCYPYKYIKPYISPLLNTKYLTNSSRSKLTTTVNDCHKCKTKTKTIKSYIEKVKWNNSATERKDSQCNSRNSYIRHSNNSQSSPSKLQRIIKKNVNRLKKYSKSPKLPYNNISNTLKANKNSNKHCSNHHYHNNKQATIPTIISEIDNVYPLTSRNELDNIPFYIVNKLISKIIT